MKRNTLFIVGITSICLPSIVRPQVQTKGQGPARSLVALPGYSGFSVNITLSEKAMGKLLASKETVIAIAYLTGVPIKGAQKKYMADPSGWIDLGEIDVEILPGQIAHFGQIKLNQEAFEQTDKRDPQLLINVVSGRKSSENNLLDCGIYEGQLKPIQGTSIPISCKLIHGE